MTKKLKIAIGQMEVIPGRPDLNFKKIEELMKPEGTAVIQAITYPDEGYETYRKGCDFIQKFIFPGSLLPSIGAMESSINLTELKLENIEKVLNTLKI